MLAPLGMKMYIPQACVENALSWLFLFIYSILMTTKIIEISAISFSSIAKQNNKLKED